MQHDTTQQIPWRQFLLGELSEADRQPIEDTFIRDRDSFASMEIAEFELIEDYLTHALNARDTALFESAYMRTAVRRERVDRMRLLIQELSFQNQAKRVDPAPASLGDQISAFFKVYAWRTAAVGVTCLILLVAGLLLINRQTGIREMAKTGPPTLEVPASSNLPAREDSVTRNDADSPTSATSRDARPSPSATPEKRPRAVPEPVYAVFFLRPGSIRGEAAGTRVRIATGTTEVGLQLALESRSYPHYTARVTTVEGKAVFTSGRLKANKSSILLRVPVKSLSRGDYIVELAGITAAGTSESVDDYAFTLEK
ncbi:MAG: hypothetical protein WKF34_14150 [Pyrinomonadaceae bacterium]